MCGNDAREAGALANARTMDVYAGRMAKVSDEPAPRVEVVQDLFRAVREHDDELLAAIAEPTAAEWDEATDLLAMDKAGDILDRRTEALTLLLPERETPRPRGVTWEAVLGGLEPGAVARLDELYDDMPPGARAEYDRRYGRPPGASAPQDGDKPDG